MKTTKQIKIVVPKTPAFCMSDVKDLLTTLMDCEDIEEVQHYIKQFAPGIFN